MKISLCLIVRDETRFLQGCVDSCRPCVDEIVIVDTGSVDETPVLARRLATSFHQVAFDGDFSAARNEALEHATGDWILFLDADERLIPGEIGGLVAGLENAPPDVLGMRLMRYNFFSDGGFYTGRELRVFRNLPTIRYRRRINESVAPSIQEAGGRVVDAPVVFNHFGHCRPVGEREAKAHRYLRLMDEQLRDQPDDAVLWGYQGLILRTLGEFDTALARSSRAVEIDPESATAWFFHGHVLRSVGRDTDALDAYQRAVSIKPEHAAAQLMVGVQYMALGDFRKAADAFVRGRALDAELLHTDINLGLLAQATGEWDEAITLFRRAGERNPGFFHDEFGGRTERDPFRCFYKETPLGYAGLAYHLGYCTLRAAGQVPPSGR